MSASFTCLLWDLFIGISFVSMIWFAELSVYHDVTCSIWLFTLFSNPLPCTSKGIYASYVFLVFKCLCSRFSHWIPASVFIPYSGAILIVLLCIWICQTDPEHTIMLYSCGSTEEDLNLHLPKIDTNESCYETVHSQMMFCLLLCNTCCEWMCNAMQFFME